MADQEVAHHAAGARDDVQGAGRKGLLDDLREAEGGQRRAAGGLEDAGVAGGQGRGQLPGGHVHRVVPGCDRGDHAHRVPPDHRRPAFHVLGHREPLGHAAGACEEAEQVAGHAHLVDGGPDRLAGLQGLETADLVGVRVEQVRDLEEREAAGLRGGMAPALERLGGGVHRAVHILLARGRDVRNGLVDGGVLDGLRLTGRGVDPLAADELLVRLHVVTHLPAVSWSRHLDCWRGRRSPRRRAAAAGADCAATRRGHATSNTATCDGRMHLGPRLGTNGPPDDQWPPRAYASCASSATAFAIASYGIGGQGAPRLRR